MRWLFWAEVQTFLNNSCTKIIVFVFCPCQFNNSVILLLLHRFGHWKKKEEKRKKKKKNISYQVSSIMKMLFWVWLCWWKLYLFTLIERIVRWHLWKKKAKKSKNKTVLKIILHEEDYQWHDVEILKSLHMIDV